MSLNAWHYTSLMRKMRSNKLSRNVEKIKQLFDEIYEDLLIVDPVLADTASDAISQLSWLYGSDVQIQEVVR